MATSPKESPLPKTIQSPAVDFSKPIDLAGIQGLTILITGGASGIGAGCFSLWAEHGATVIIGDRNQPAGEALVEKLRSSTSNTNLHFLPLDVTDWQSQVSFFREARKLSPHGGIDCVVANAGISGALESRAFAEPPDYDQVEDDPPPPPKLTTMDINVTGVLYTVHLAQAYLPRNPGSAKCSTTTTTSPRDRHLILVSSMAGLLPIASQSLYCASKHAVVGLFRALRVTTPITHGIRVNLLCPYFANTPILSTAGTMILAGSGLASVDSIVDAATRLVADHTIIGRGLAIGPKASPDEAMAAGFDVVNHGDEDGNGSVEQQAAWDVYAHDFNISDLFSRRIIALANLKAAQRGLPGLLTDLGWALTSPIWRLFTR